MGNVAKFDKKIGLVVSFTPEGPKFGEIWDVTPPKRPSKPSAALLRAAAKLRKEVFGSSKPAKAAQRKRAK